jgi:hypothetical protein
MSSWSNIVSKNSSKKVVKKVEQPIIQKSEEKMLSHLQIFNDNLGEDMLNDVYENLNSSRQNSLLNHIDGIEIYKFFMNYVNIEDEVDNILSNAHPESSDDLSNEEIY